MTADHIAFHALERPDAVALIDRGRSITYAAFDRDLRRMTTAAAELGVPKGGTVAVGARLYTEWLLLLAFERLGIVTVSLDAMEGPETIQLLAGVDLAMAEPHFPEVAARRQHDITPEWLAQVLGREGGPEPELPARSPEDPVRTLRTSGTTGQPKRILHRRRQHEAWIMRW